MVGRQTPFLALIVPFILVFIVDGMRGVRQTWPVVLIGGLRFGPGPFRVLNSLAGELAGGFGSIAPVLSMVSFLQFWHPGEPLLAESGGAGRPAVAGAS